MCTVLQEMIEVRAPLTGIAATPRTEPENKFVFNTQSSKVIEFLFVIVFYFIKFYWYLSHELLNLKQYVLYIILVHFNKKKNFVARHFSYKVI